MRSLVSVIARERAAAIAEFPKKRAATATEPEITVADAPGDSRVEIRIEGALAGFVAYRRQPGVIAFVHTEIAESVQGHGLASTLIEGALAQARAEGLQVLPFCPFVRGYIESHPGDLDLVPRERRAQFKLPVDA